MALVAGILAGAAVFEFLVICLLIWTLERLQKEQHKAVDMCEQLSAAMRDALKVGRP